MAATDNTKFLNKTQYEVAMQRLAQVTGRTLGADTTNTFKANLSSSDRVLGSWTHPNNGTMGAKTISAANTKVLSAITVDAYGHVTSVAEKTLAAADIPSLAWSKITSGKPTTLSGYGITDAKIEAVTGGDKITLGSNNITVADWAQGTGTKIASSALPSLYIGTTAVSATSGAVTNLVGVVSFSPGSAGTGAFYFDDSIGIDGGWEFDSSLDIVDRLYIGGGDNPYLYWDSSNSAWHLTGNFIADGYVSAGGVSTTPGGGGGGGSSVYTVNTWSGLDATDSDQAVGSALGIDINNRVAALENSATNVSFTQTLSSGKQVGTITIDGTSTNLYAPGTYALTDITGADDLQAIEGLTGTSGALVKTGANTWSLRTISDSSSAGALSSSNTNFVTERDVYYGLPKINNAHNYTSSSAYYAPTSGGTSGYILKANGSTSAPTWDSVSNIMSAYATTASVTQAIADAIDGVTSFEYSIVTTLPTTGVKGTIYLISHTHGTQDVYDEYIWVGDGYEKIGNTDIDLSGYWSTSDLVAITATENTTLLNTYFPVS